MADIAVVTIVRGRLDHLAVQQAALRAQPTAHERVVVQMGGPDVRGALGVDDVHVVELPDDSGPLPLAAARNAGVAAATADLLVLLDVDCVPAPDLLVRYGNALERVGGLVAGPVGYLPPGATAGGSATPTQLAALAEPHPARPVPRDDELLPEHRQELFWSLSFAVRRADWNRIGGFCERYRGYGGEDTDFAWSARRAGIGLHWVGGGWAWHQHHSTENPPRRHLADIVRNSTIFYERWGTWPMEGWLDAFRIEGLIDWTPRGNVLRLTKTGRARAAGGTGGPGG